MKSIKSHLWYNRSQRNGIFLCILLILGFQGVFFFVDFKLKSDVDSNSFEIAAFQERINRLKEIELERRRPKRHPFNPSFLTDFKGYQWGMDFKEIDRLLAHRAQGNYINSAEQFQEVTGVSDSLLRVMSPYFKFPEWVKKKRHIKFESKDPLKDIYNWPKEKIDLNRASPDQFRKINGIGKVLSQRIVNYRSSLNGFSSEKQLYEVYGLKHELVEKILHHFELQSEPTIKKLNINTATFKEVLRLPYIDYELTKKIFQYRDQVAELQSISELKNIESFPLENYEKIIVYLEAK